MAELLNIFTTLNKPIHWGTVRSQFKLNPYFDEDLVGNVSIVPTIRGQYVMMQLDNGSWELAGGTLEPGETYMECLNRELLEELGAELIDYHVIGHFACINHAKEPYRPHLPFPNFVRVIGTGEVNIVTQPLNPEGGEKVAIVEAVDIDEAVKRFTENGRLELAELYLLTHQLRNPIVE